MSYRLIYIFILLSMISGCASMSGWESETAPDNFIDGTTILGEVVMVPTKDEAFSNNGIFKDLKKKLVSVGYNDADISDGSLVSIWTYCYGWNSGVPLCSHHGHYIAYVPENLRGTINGDKDDRAETNGDLVEVTLTKTSDNKILGRVKGKYADGDDWKNCRESGLNQTSNIGVALSTLAMVGPPQAMWIECDMEGSSGWLRRPVPGPSSDGPPISEWIKLP